MQTITITSCVLHSGNKRGVSAPPSGLRISNEHEVPLDESTGDLNSAYPGRILRKDREGGSKESVEIKSVVQNHKSFHHIIATLTPFLATTRRAILLESSL